MRIQQRELVPLGHGIWVRSDEILAVEPIREKRGPGRRAHVWLRGIEEPFVASRSEEAIIRDLTRPREAVERGERLEGAVERVTSAIDRIPPVLLRVVAQETGQDLRTVASEAREALSNNGAGAQGRRRNASKVQREQAPLLAD
ncbi:MAG TPA: hypothetical protein VIH05_10645 [Tepidiformaceae bacterium]